MSCINRHFAETVAVFLFVAFSGLYGQTGHDRLVVMTDDPVVLQDYVAGRALDMIPLVSYPHPSSGVKTRFGDYGIVSVNNDEIEVVAHEIIKLKGVRQVEVEEVNHIEVFESDKSVTCPLPDTFYDPYIPNDPLYDQQWEKTITQTDWGWNRTRGDSAVIIAIIDTGADSDHEDLIGNLIAGYNTIDDNDNWEDDNGHGTHTSGIAAAEIDNVLGIAGTAGKCTILPLKAANQHGEYYNSDLAEAIIYATDNGAQVINMSLGGNSSTVLEDAVGYAWDSAGVFLCAASGNKNQNISEYPAAYEEVISVGATSYGDIRWRLSQGTGSNYGESVDVYAPGNSIYSTYFSGGYQPRDGTSMASPQVAGLAALIWSEYPHYSNQEVWDLIVSTADTVEIDVGSALRINVRRALGVVGVIEDSPLYSQIHADKIQRGKIEISHNLPITSGYRLKLFDVTGCEVYSTRGMTDGSGALSFKPELAPAVYFWQLEHDWATASGKFVYFK